MLPHVRQRRLKPNWWTISPLITSLLLWGAILGAGVWTGSTLNGDAERVAAITAADQAAAWAH